MKTKISFKEAILYWLKLGFISFGGPAAQISMMHEEIVEKKKWIDDKSFFHALNFTMILPGPEAQQLATYLGWLMHGRLGGLIAGTLFILPSFFILSLLTYIYINYSDNIWGEGILYGIKAAVIAIIFSASIKIAKKVLKKSYYWMTAVAAFLAINILDINLPIIIIIAGTIGFLFHYLKNNNEYKKKSPLEFFKNKVIKKSMKTLFIALSIWSIVFFFIIYTNESILINLSLFFSQAALVTFGGAYALLPYVFQNIIESHGWLTSQQMIDGLALGESTPGPLIMIVTYVGFIVGWYNDILNLGSPITGAIICAVLATFFTFLPSFAFIFIGAPLIELTKDNKSFEIPLNFITSAVVGLIVNLGYMLAYNSLWTDNNGTKNFDIHLLILIVFSLLALTKAKVGILPLLITLALTGMMMKFYF
ncbi:MAG: chromate efflux transporter [Gammaproteobacteria bacterium]|nr:chromate efflux transporter [Gammaproteobacteria bacterium]MBT7523796.1 chromate efflux transporter [Gammaproteobacteria bacterium]